MPQTLTQKAEIKRLSIQAGISLRGITSGDILYDWMNQRNLLVTQISPYYINLVFRDGLSRTPVTVQTRRIIDGKYTDEIISSQTYDWNNPDEALRLKLFHVADQYLSESGL